MREKLRQTIIMFGIFALLISACTSSQPPQATSLAPATNPPQVGTQPPPTKEPESSPQEMVKLKVSILPFLSYGPIFIAKEEGYFSEQGLEVEFVRIDQTSEAMPALAQGQIDVASGFFDVSTLNAIAKGANIRYVSDKGYLDPEGCSSATFVVRKDLLQSGTLDDLSNLKGMKIALTPASAAEYALDVLLKDIGLSSADVEVLNIPLPARLEGMINKSVDIAAVSDPWTVRMVSGGYGEVWNPWEKLLPNFQMSINMYGPNLLEKNKDVGKRYLIAYLKAVRQYNEGKTPRNVEILAQYTQMEPAEVEQSCWMSMRSDGMLDISAMTGFQDWAVAKGLQISLVPAEDLLDLSILDEAKAALK